MYFRKWTRMDYNESVRLFKKYNLITFTDNEAKLNLFPIQEQQKFIDSIKAKRQKQLEKEREENKKLIDTLLTKYPDLRYEPLSQVIIIHGFILKYIYSFLNTIKKISAIFSLSLSTPPKKNCIFSLSLKCSYFYLERL